MIDKFVDEHVRYEYNMLKYVVDNFYRESHKSFSISVPLEISEKFSWYLNNSLIETASIHTLNLIAFIRDNLPQWITLDDKSRKFIRKFDKQIVGLTKDGRTAVMADKIQPNEIIDLFDNVITPYLQNNDYTKDIFACRN